MRPWQFPVPRPFQKSYASFVTQKGITNLIALNERHGRSRSRRKPVQQQEFGNHLTTKLFDYRGAIFFSGQHYARRGVLE
jgi:hypothetical protein